MTKKENNNALQGKVFTQILDLIDVAYDSGWLAGKIEALTNKNIRLEDSYREEHLGLIQRRNARKSDLVALINEIFRRLNDE